MPLFRLLFQRTVNLKYLYAIRLTRELSFQLVVFFLPLYFFNLPLNLLPNHDLSSLQQGMLNVAVLYFMQFSVVLLSSMSAAQILLKYGVRTGFILGHLFYALFILLLYLSKDNPYYVFTAVVAMGLQTNLFWNSYYYALSRHSAPTKMGSNLGAINFFLNLLSMISPAIGGIIIVALGYETLFLLGLTIVLLGAAFSFMLENVHIRDHISWREFWQWWKAPTFRKLALTFSGKYVNDASINLWTLYMFLLLGSIKSVGFFYSLALFLALLASYFIGPLLDKNRGARAFRLSGGMLSAFWVARALTLNIWTITIINAFDKVTASFHWLFFDRAWILRGKGREALSYFVYRMMIYSFAAMVFWVAIALLFYFFGNAWQSLFVMAALGVLLTLLVKEHKEHKEQVEQ